MACRHTRVGSVKLGPHTFNTVPIDDSLKIKLKNVACKKHLTYEKYRMVKYHMGNGHPPISDPEEAARKLMEREYPELDHGNQKGAIFIPAFFVGKDPELVKDLDDAKKELIKKEGPRSDNEIIKRFYKQQYHTSRRSGDGAEKEVFDALEDIFKNDAYESSDIIVLHDLSVINRESKRTREQEHDFVIFFPSRKLISLFEVKASFSEKNYNKACEQTEKCQKFLEKYFSDILGNDEWQFCRTVYFSNKKNASLCTGACQMWELFSPSDIKTWWQQIKKQYSRIPEEKQNESRENILEVIRLMLFVIHKKQPITTSKCFEKSIEVTDKIGSADNILFWSQGQLDLLTRDEPFVVFKSGFGSGKSVLLRTKAEQEATKLKKAGSIQKCLYVIGGREISRNYTLLQMSLLNDWAKEDFFDNIELLSMFELMVSIENIS